MENCLRANISSKATKSGTRTAWMPLSKILALAATIHGKLSPRTAQHGTQGSPVELETQKPHDWIKWKRGALHVKPELEAPLLSDPSTLAQHVAKTAKPRSASSATPHPPSTQRYRLNLRPWSSSVSNDKHHHHVRMCSQWYETW